MTRAELDSRLKQAVSVGMPVEVYDPTTNEVFYLISAEQFQKLAAGQVNDFDPRQAYPLIEHVMAEDDALDPLLDTYQ